MCQLDEGFGTPWQHNSTDKTFINTLMTNYSFSIFQITDSIIQDKEYEVMMQIDCEVTDTRILHIRSSTIPPLLRVNHTNTVYQHSPNTEKTAAPPVGVLMGSAWDHKQHLHYLKLFSSSTRTNSIRISHFCSLICSITVEIKSQPSQYRSCTKLA